MGKEQQDDSSRSSSSRNGEGLPRAQSNLEILSQTAAVIEECLSGSSAQTSPYPATARVTPADSIFLLENLQQQCRSKSYLSIPDMTGTTATTQQQQQPSSIFLEQKRGFLPPALQFETGGGGGGGVLVGHGHHHVDGVEASPYYSPGLFLSYSNGSATAAAAPANSYPSRGADTQQPVATVSNGSEASSSSDTGGGGNSHGVPVGDVAAAATLGPVNSFLLTNSGSFSSGGGSGGTAAGNSSFHPLTLTGGSNHSIAAHAQRSMQAAFVPPRPALAQRLLSSAPSFGEGIEFSDEAVRENFMLRQQLASRDATIDALQKQVEDLQQEIRQLRQLPTGKVSQIPLEDMLAIMREYGSEVSDTAMPPRKSYVQKASVVRQFRRWNPNFLEWFEHVHGKWVPKLGKTGELKRRQEARRAAAMERKKKAAQEDEELSALDKTPKMEQI